MDFRNLDATAVNVISVYPKVLDILNGKIPPPEVAEFFLTNYCSFKCLHCRCAGTHEGKNSFIDFNLYKSILNELAEIGCNKIEFGGGGEPLEHPRITEILQYIKEKNMRCGLITNGYALINDNELAEAIAETADWVRISLDAVSNESYRKIHGCCDLSYNSLKSSLKSFVQTAKKNNNSINKTRLGIKLIIQQINKNELEQVLDETLEIGADYLQFKWLENHPSAIPVDERKRISELLCEIKFRAGETIPIDFLAGYGGENEQNADKPCILSVLHPLIDWDGKVYICAFFQHRKDRHCIGDLSVKSFDEIWNSPEHKLRREKVNTHECVTNCPIKRYNPVIDFINREAYRFHYI